MEASEIEFLTEETLISVIPRFSCRKSYFITGEIGPFRAGIPVKVPLWLAVDIKKRQKGEIVLPEWMNVDLIDQLKEKEIFSMQLCKIPSENFFVAAKIILGYVAENYPNIHLKISSIKDLYERRRAKIHGGLEDVINAQPGFFSIANITISEVRMIKTLVLGFRFGKNLDKYNKRKKKKNEEMLGKKETLVATLDSMDSDSDPDSEDDTQSMSSLSFCNFSNS